MECYLAKHVYFCWRADAVVFLNLKADEYSLLEGEKVAYFRLLVRAATTSQRSPEGPPAGATNCEGVAQLVDELLRDGILVTDRDNGKPIAPTIADLPTEHLISPTTRPTVRIRLTHIVTFFISCTAAALRLRFQQIEATVSAVERRKALLSPKYPCDIERSRYLVAVFTKLRSFFPANYLCLFDSLALIEFLAHYRIFPCWIFAVRPEFWAAHCWVQKDHMSFNEDVEEADDYVPIMVI